MFKKTGLIYLATAPTGAQIRIDQKDYQGTTPAIIDQLLPGEYSTSITLDGYRPWQMEIPIEVQKATALDKILLTPSEWEVKTVVQDNFTDLIALPDTGYLLLMKKGEMINEAVVCNYNSGKVYPLVSGEYTSRAGKIDHIEARKNQTTLLASYKSDGAKKYLWITLGQDRAQISDITKLMPISPDVVLWENDNGPLFVSQGTYLDKVDIAGGAVYPQYIKEVKGAGILNGAIYLLRKDDTLVTVNFNGENETVILDDSILGNKIFGKRKRFEIKVFPENILVFIGEGGELLSNRLPYSFVKEGTRGQEYYDDTKSLLIWRKDRIGILDFSTEETQNTQFEKGPTLTWVYTKGKEIDDCFWAYQGSHILFKENNEIFLLEMEVFGREIKTHIASAAPKSSIYYAEDAGEVFYVAKEDGALQSIQIVPDKSAIPISFEDMKNTEKEEDVKEKQP